MHACMHACIKIGLYVKIKVFDKKAPGLRWMLVFMVPEFSVYAYPAQSMNTPLF